MIYNTAKAATKRKSDPTIQCLVQKHAPAARKMRVAAIGAHCTAERYCMRNWMEGFL